MPQTRDTSISNVYVLHSYNGDTEQGLLPGIETIFAELELPVFFPHFPIRDEATFESWDAVLSAEANTGRFGENTIVITHSLSTLFLPRYLSEHNIRIGGHISCAGFLDDPVIDDSLPVSEHRRRFRIGFKNMQRFPELCPHRHCLYGAFDQHNPEQKMSAYADAMSAQKHLLPNTILDTWARTRKISLRHLQYSSK